MKQLRQLLSTISKPKTAMSGLLLLSMAISSTGFATSAQAAEISYLRGGIYQAHWDDDGDGCSKGSCPKTKLVVKDFPGDVKLLTRDDPRITTFRARCQDSFKAISGTWRFSGDVEGVELIRSEQVDDKTWEFDVHHDLRGEDKVLVKTDVKCAKVVAKKKHW